MRYIIKPEDEAKKKPIGGIRNNYFSSTSDIIHCRVPGQKKTKLLAQPLKLFCKEVKFNDPRTVILEAFNAEFTLAMVGSERTPRHYLMVDAEDKEIVGIACERVELEVFRFTDKDNYWENIKPQDCAIISTWDALAGEDDKHKGNVAKKIKQKTQQQQGAAQTTPEKKLEDLFSFDHDMKEYQPFYSRLGHGGRWFFHPFSRYRHGMSTNDFAHFPITQKFNPHFWYGRKNFASPNKTYNHTDKQQMMRYSTNDQFIDEKVLLTLRWILFPEEIMHAAMQQHRHPDCKLYWLYLNEKKNRQAEIQAIALGTAQFREHLAKNKTRYLKRAQDALQEYCDEVGVPTPDLTLSFNALCKLSAVCHKNGDTPLHAAVRAHAQDKQSFRYEETFDALTEHKLDFKNNALIPSAQQTAAELAISLGQNQVAQFLVDNGASKPTNLPDKMTRPLLEMSAKILLLQMHADIVAGQNALDTLAISLKNLREQTCLSKKMKKHTAILMFMRAMPHVKSYYGFNRAHHIFKHHLNHFIDQLRSQFEIVRFLRGDLYGTTDTSKTISHMLYKHGRSLIKSGAIQDKHQKRLARKLLRGDFKHCYSFFGLFMKKIKVELPQDCRAQRPTPAA